MIPHKLSRIFRGRPQQKNVIIFIVTVLSLSLYLTYSNTENSFFLLDNRRDGVDNGKDARTTRPMLPGVNKYGRVGNENIVQQRNILDGGMEQDGMTTPKVTLLPPVESTPLYQHILQVS